MIFAQLKAYGWMAVAIALGAVAGMQTLRLHTAQLDAAQTRTAHADTLRKIADLTAAAYQAALVERDTNNRKRQEALDANRLLEAALRGDLLRAATESERMRDQLTYAGRLLAATAGRASPEVVAEYAAAATDVLNQCRAEVVRLAAASDGHAADARLLHQSQ